MEIPKHKIEELKAYDNKLSAKVNEEGKVSVWRDTPRGRKLVNTFDRLDNTALEELEWGNLMKQDQRTFDKKLRDGDHSNAKKMDALRERNERDAWNYKRKQMGFKVPKFYAGAARKVS